MMVLVIQVRPFVDRLPKRKRSTESPQDRKLFRERQAFEDIVNLAWSHPNKRLEMLASMKLDLEAPETKLLESQGFMFKVPPPTLGQVDDQWVAGYLKDRYEALTDEVLGAIEAADILNLRNLLHNHEHASNTLRLPQERQDKRVLRDLLEHRTEEVGPRMEVTEEVAAEIIQNKGIVPWGKLGPFAVVIEPGKAAKALHRPSNTLADIDEDMGVQNGGWGLDTNWSDEKCVLEKLPARRHNMLDFF